MSRYHLTPYLYPNRTYRTVISLNRLPVATTVNAYDYNAGCGIMASVNEARDVIGALEYQDYQYSLKPVTVPTVQVAKVANYWPELERLYRMLSLPLQWIGAHMKVRQ